MFRLDVFLLILYQRLGRRNVKLPSIFPIDGKDSEKISQGVRRGNVAVSRHQPKLALVESVVGLRLNIHGH